jgi:7-carboxy-7-deazaguanine synthase
MKNRTLKVKEMFYSLQGEGGRTGHPSIFIRLAGCNLSCSFCDTKGHNTDYTEMTLDSILYNCMKLTGKTPNGMWIVWTGGEPTLQLDSDIVLFFKEKGYKQAIETNGTGGIPAELDYIVVSPKVEETRPGLIVNEVRVPYPTKLSLSKIRKEIPADNYYLSPIFTDNEKTTKFNIKEAVKCCLYNGIWKLSLQTHKLIEIQ